MQARLQWLKTARPPQIAPDHDWRIWLILAGRGWGKTRTGAEDLAHYALWHEGARLGVVAPTFADGRDICVEGESGLLRTLPESCVRQWNRSQGALNLVNGTRIKIFSADRPDRLRGPQHHRVWCDELAAWSRPEAFDQVLFGLRLGADPRLVITTTPRPMPLLRALALRAGMDVHLTRGVTRDNAAHLAETALDALEARYAGTRLGRQELLAELLEDNHAALWQPAMMEDIAADKPCPVMPRKLVAVDPALSHGAASDETGIIAAGIGADGLFYVLDDRSGRYPCDVWAARAAQLAAEIGAQQIIVEVNAGGELVTRIVGQYAPRIPCRAVRAVRGKWERAVPVAALYEQRRVRHAAAMPELEAQMLNFMPEAFAGHSPDRADALVWALSTLLESPWAQQPLIRGL